MPDQITVTGKVGPGLTLTAGVFTNVTRFEVDTVNGVLSAYCDQGSPRIVSIGAASTFTVTLSSNNYTIVIS